MKPDKLKEGAFSKENSLAIKAIAIIMMMWHHCFSAGRFEKYAIDFWPLTQSQAINVANFCKICVSLFVFVSGYGLYLTWQKARERGVSTSRWVYEKLVRTLSGFWFVLILAWVVCTFLDNRPYRVYGFEQSTLLGLWNMLMEFLGLTNLTGGALLNSTWWYMSAAVVFIVLFPLIYWGFERMGCFCTLGVILIFPRLSMGFPGWTHFYAFMPIFCIGMMCARYDVFARWDRFWDGRATYVKALKLLLMAASLLAIYKVFYHINVNTWWDVMWNLFPVPVIFFAKDYLFKIPGLNQILVFIGKHATNIFLVHTFIRYYYCTSFTYGMGYFLLVMGVLLFISLGFSIVIEGLKKGLRYQMWIDRLLGVPDKLHGKTMR